MNINLSLAFSACLLLAACSFNNAANNSAATKTSAPNEKPIAIFDWFEYSGDDELFRSLPAVNEYQNPILSGFHPDPSIVRVGSDYYLINSTFGFFPGLPIFHSTDLVNWTQIGNVIHRPEQLNFDGLHLGYNGLYAPAIEYRDGTFYVINTCVGCGGNFVVTAKNPAGPWSDPIFMSHLAGIDPSIFFDDDGRTYVVHHRDPDPGIKRYPAHTALWVMEVDPVTFEARSEDVMLVDGGIKQPWNTDYHEGPHIYKVNGQYYLSAPGGGTGYYHQQLAYRADNIFGPYQPNPKNPILTQYGLPDNRDFPVTATGHADMVEDTNGDWWTVFLGTRIYDLEKPPQDPGRFHTGRETFMLPVHWEDGWPIILDKGLAVPAHVKKPNLPEGKPAARPLTGNFKELEGFNEKELAPHWLFIRTPHDTWWQAGNGKLQLQARSDRVGAKKQPSFIGRRLAHMNADWSTKLNFHPRDIGDEAGLLAIQNSEHFISFVLGVNAAGESVLSVRARDGGKSPVDGIALAQTAIKLKKGQSVYLRMSIDKAVINFSYSLNGKQYQDVLRNADASPLTTASAGGFTGAVVGMLAQRAK